MPTKSVSISPEVETVLRGATLTGNVLSIGGGILLPKKLYADTDKVLRALGGAWDRKAKGHVFPRDPIEMLAGALNAGKAVDAKKSFELFETPEPLARRMVALACRDGDRVLEPSAGHGRILKALCDMDLAGSVTGVELNDFNFGILRDRFSAFPGVSLVHADFPVWAKQEAPRFGSAVMNPPFSRNADIAHISWAWRLLAPGGRIAAICSEHGFFAEDQQSCWFRDWLKTNRITDEKLPDGAFRESGTGVSARLIYGRKG